jgi:hypothetical protein
MRRLLALAVLVVTAAATVACDPCAWLSENGVTPSGHCTAG